MFTAPSLQSLLAGHRLLGASTGYMAGSRGNWPNLLSQAARVSETTIELSALSGEELAPLQTFLAARPESVTRFERLSVHGPSKGWEGSTQTLVDALLELPGCIAGIVMHPDTMGDLPPYEALGARVWLENMDTRKGDGRTVDELDAYFAALPQARFCFDIAHAGLHDPSMGLAHELLDAYGGRLAEVHLSSIEEDGTHVPLRAEDLDRFAGALGRCRGVPWILEAPLAR